jgi:enoyl-[acyl-carrier protein] reductase I
MYGIDLSGKVAVVASVANKWSIAWGIAKVLHEAGCTLVLPYLGEREKKGIEKLLSSEGVEALVPPDPCNASNDEDVDRLFSFVSESAGRLDAFAHCMAFAPKEALQGAFADTTREAYHIAMDVSAYSFVSMTKAASNLMTDGGSAITLTFMASEKVFPHYNVMGSAKAALEHAVRQLAYELGPKNVRVNAVSAGPISTVSARGVAGFLDFLDTYKEKAPLHRGVTQKEVGKTALFLLSELGSGVTGEVVHVDGGYNIMGI